MADRGTGNGADYAPDGRAFPGVAVAADDGAGHTSGGGAEDSTRRFTGSGIIIGCDTGAQEQARAERGGDDGETWFHREVRVGKFFDAQRRGTFKECLSGSSLSVCGSL